MRISALLVVVTAAGSLGCAAPLTTAMLSGSRNDEASAESPEGVAAAEKLRAGSVHKATAVKPPTHDEALAGVLQELQDVKAIDPEAERQLMADLKEAK